MKNSEQEYVYILTNPSFKEDWGSSTDKPLKIDISGNGHIYYEEYESNMQKVYMETDFSTLTNSDFDRKLREYCAFKLLSQLD